MPESTSLDADMELEGLVARPGKGSITYAIGGFLANWRFLFLDPPASQNKNPDSQQLPDTLGGHRQRLTRKGDVLNDDARPAGRDGRLKASIRTLIDLYLGPNIEFHESRAGLCLDPNTELHKALNRSLLGSENGSTRPNSPSWEGLPKTKLREPLV